MLIRESVKSIIDTEIPKVLAVIFCPWRVKFIVEVSLRAITMLPLQR